MRVFDLIDGYSKTHAARHYHTHAHTYMQSYMFRLMRERKPHRAGGALRVRREALDDLSNWC